MIEHNTRRPGLKAMLLLGLCAVPLSAITADMEYSGGVTLVDGIWGRYAKISIEYMPTTSEAFEAYSDPAKKADLVASMMAAEQTHPAVSIIVPGLEYGHVGTYPGLRIETNDGISIIPTGRIGSPSNPNSGDYTGVLTLTVFTSERMAGSYSADLYKKDLTDAEGRLGSRPFVGHVEATFDINLASPVNQGQIDAMTEKMLPDVPDNMSDADQKLLQEIQAAGVPPEMQGAMLEQLRGLPEGMRKMVLDSYNDSY